MPVQQRAALEPDVAERDARVVQVVSGGLRAHVRERDALHRSPARVPQRDEERVRPDAPIVHQQISHDHRFRRDESLRDPVFPRARVGGAEQETPAVAASGVWDPRARRVHDQTAVHAGEALGEREAPERAVPLHLLQLPQVRRAAQLQHRPGEKVVLHGEADAEPRTLVEARAGQQPVRLEKLRGGFHQVLETEHAGPHERGEAARGVRVGRRGGREHLRELRTPSRAPRRAVVGRFGMGMPTFFRSRNVTHEHGRGVPAVVDHAERAGHRRSGDRLDTSG